MSSRRRTGPQRSDEKGLAQRQQRERNGVREKEERDLHPRTAPHPRHHAAGAGRQTEARRAPLATCVIPGKGAQLRCARSGRRQRSKCSKHSQQERRATIDGISRTADAPAAASVSVHRRRQRHRNDHASGRACLAPIALLTTCPVRPLSWLPVRRACLFLHRTPHILVRALRRAREK